jgi:hypothetical protein
MLLAVSQQYMKWYLSCNCTILTPGVVHLQGTVFRYPRPQLQERLLQLTLNAPPLLLRKMPKQQHALYHITYLARQLAMQPLQDPDKMEACAAVPDINALLRSAEAAGENVGPATRTMIGALSLMRSCGISHAWVGTWCGGAWQLLAAIEWCFADWHRSWLSRHTAVEPACHFSWCCAT